MADLDISREACDWAFMSDRQKGLIKAIDNMMPYVEHRYCVLHMYNNFKVAHKGWH